ncbi:MAG: PorV/PorQ family protein [Balneolaceae bacterium]
MRNRARQGLGVLVMLAGLWLLPGVGAGEAEAQVISRSGTSAGQFLTIPVGARAAALGSAVTATAEDATALFWNPGALALADRQVMVEHAEWFPGLSHNFAGVVLPLPNKAVVGLHVVALSVDDMEETTFDQEEGTGRFFSAGSYTVGVSYAQFLMDDFAFGGTIKYVHESIDNSSAGGFAIDLGTHFVTPFDGIRFGVRLANFGEKLNIDGRDLTTTVDIDPGSQGNNNQIDARLDTDDFDMPLMLQVGLAWDAVQSRELRATVMADGVSPSDDKQSVNVGVELAFFEELFALQAGLGELFKGDDRMNRYAFGGQVAYSLQSGVKLNIGYALSDHKFLGLTNRFSLKIGF